MLYPLKLAPVFKYYLWGGEKLKQKYGKKAAQDNISESWELSDHKDGICRITNGQYADVLFDSYLQLEGVAVLGGKCAGTKVLPLLIKILDTRQSLSIQVHPDDAYAWAHEEQRGKTELWYVMECEKDSKIFYGMKHKMSRQELLDGIENGTITEKLNLIPVKQGEVYLIEPGMIHAIGAGMTVAEIGTNSNITYRIYDFDRRDGQGKKRELHKSQAADVIRDMRPKCHKMEGILDCGKFKVEKIIIEGGETVEHYADAGTFQSLIILNGECDIMSEKGNVRVKRGDSVFIPAGMGRYQVRGIVEILKTTV